MTNSGRPTLVKYNTIYEKYRRGFTGKKGHFRDFGIFEHLELHKEEKVCFDEARELPQGNGDGRLI